MKTKIFLFILITITLLSFSCGKNKVLEIDLNTNFDLKFEQYAEIKNENLSVKFQNVNDSRCPKGTNCIWQGEGLVTLNVNTSLIEFSTNHPIKDTLGYTFSLVSLLPEPDISKKNTNKDYILKMKVSK
jgi:hypothetical protein